MCHKCLQVGVRIQAPIAMTARLQSQGYLSAMGVLSKVSMLLFTACFMQIPFREHMLVQGIQVEAPCVHHLKLPSMLLELHFPSICAQSLPDCSLPELMFAVISAKA